MSLFSRTLLQKLIVEVKHFDDEMFVISQNALHYSSIEGDCNMTGYFPPASEACSYNYSGKRGFGNSFTEMLTVLQVFPPARTLVTLPTVRHQTRPLQPIIRETFSSTMVTFICSRSSLLSIFTVGMKCSLSYRHLPLPTLALRRLLRAFQPPPAVVARNN